MSDLKIKLSDTGQVVFTTSKWWPHKNTELIFCYVAQSELFEQLTWYAPDEMKQEILIRIMNSWDERPEFER